MASLTVTAPVTAEPDVTVPKTPEEALLHAARYIEEHGWCQGALERDTGQVCMAGAIMRVTGRPLYGGLLGLGHDQIFDGALDRIQLHLGGAVANWNDRKERTEAEVIEALRAAAR
jgi:hypothetical protein